MPNFGGSRPGYWFKRPPRTKTGKVLIVREEVGPNPFGYTGPVGGYWREGDAFDDDSGGYYFYVNKWFQEVGLNYFWESDAILAVPRNNGQVIKDKRIFSNPRVYQDATVTETGTKIELTGRPWDERFLKISSQLDDKTPYMSVGKYYEYVRNLPVKGPVSNKIFDLDPVWGDHPPSFYPQYIDGQNYRPQATIVASNRTSAQLNHKHQNTDKFAVFDTIGGIKHWGMDQFTYLNNQVNAESYATITTMKEIAAFLKKAEEQLGFEVTVVKSYSELYANYTAADLQQFDHIWDIVHGALSNYRDLGVGIVTPEAMMSSSTVLAGDDSTTLTSITGNYYPSGMKYGTDKRKGEYDDENVRFTGFKKHPFVKAQRPLTAIIPEEIKTLYKSYLQSGGNIGFLNSPFQPSYNYPGSTPRLGWFRITGINDFINELGGGDVARFPAPHHMNKKDYPNGNGEGTEVFGGSGFRAPFEWNEAFKKGDLKNAARVNTGVFVNNKNYPSPKWYLNSEFFIDNSKREVDLESVSSWSYKNGKLNIGTGTPVIVGKMEPTDETITSLNAKNFNYCCAALWKRGSLSQAPQGSVFVINNIHWVVDVDLTYPTDYNSLWTKTQKDPQVASVITNGQRKEFRWVQDAYQKIVDPLFRKFAIWDSRKRDEENFLNLLQIFEKS